jgi:hypothetical protein
MEESLLLLRLPVANQAGSSFVSLPLKELWPWDWYGISDSHRVQYMSYPRMHVVQPREAPDDQAGIYIPDIRSKMRNRTGRGRQPVRDPHHKQMLHVLRGVWIPVRCRKVWVVLT